MLKIVNKQFGGSVRVCVNTTKLKVIIGKNVGAITTRKHCDSYVAPLLPLNLNLFAHLFAYLQCNHFSLCLSVGWLQCEF